eukprot:CAMPEP_0181201506 /NCGR_PEP_ID=MMETSP1096-20121128/18344_1 /TAXON_ID=156174 ORGANISM="Chrysochromulina ericina, Strain CCMP281" /NCGR_SAMPLE_ID=MMETSP1096 /ASSEMBLY_ACC=CAM_ASM_000453 /LENGTH=162 /DNA_ID=CAMNT_0023291955 /DNA_START=699 /DNA_END=1184 /DNA_ORIENTATION=-
MAKSGHAYGPGPACGETARGVPSHAPLLPVPQSRRTQEGPNVDNKRASSSQPQIPGRLGLGGRDGGRPVTPGLAGRFRAPVAAALTSLGFGASRDSSPSAFGFGLKLRLLALAIRAAAIFDATPLSLLRSLSFVFAGSPSVAVEGGAGSEVAGGGAGGGAGA